MVPRRCYKNRIANLGRSSYHHDDMIYTKAMFVICDIFVEEKDLQ